MKGSVNWFRAKNSESVGSVVEGTPGMQEPIFQQSLVPMSKDSAVSSSEWVRRFMLRQLARERNLFSIKGIMNYLFSFDLILFFKELFWYMAKALVGFIRVINADHRNM